MKRATSYREILKRVGFFIATSPLISFILFLLNVANVIIALFAGFDLLYILSTINGLLLSILLCLADFNTMDNPAKAARVARLKREVLDADNQER